MTTISLDQAQALLFHEAALLDDWQLLEWAALFTDDGQYQVPSPDQPDAEPGHSLYLIDDDRQRLGARARRLLDPAAHAESPRSRCCRMVSNIRLLDDAVVASNFVLYRARNGQMDIFPGHTRHLVQADAAGNWRIQRKRVVLSLADLRLQGMLSLIV